MYIFNYLHLKQSINTDDRKFNTYDTILNYFFISATMQNFCQIMGFFSFEFSTISSWVRNNNPKILLFYLKALVKTFHMIPYTWWCSLSTMSYKQSKLYHAWVIFEIDNIKQEVKGQLKMLKRSNDLWMCSAGSGEQMLKRTPLTTGISQRYSQFKLYA